MPIVLDDFHKMVKEVEELQHLDSKDQGILAEMMRQLLKKFGSKTYKEGVRKHKEMVDEQQGMYVRYNKAYTVFKKRFKKVLAKRKK